MPLDNFARALTGYTQSSSSSPLKPNFRYLDSDEQHVFLRYGKGSEDWLWVSESTFDFYCRYVNYYRELPDFERIKIFGEKYYRYTFELMESYRETWDSFATDALDPGGITKPKGVISNYWAQVSLPEVP